MRALFEGDKYGYEICKEIETRTNGQYKIKQPTLYSTLKRLEAQGYIKSYEDESITHGGKRRYYSLTDFGLETFTKSQNDWEYSRTVMDKLISDKEVDLSAYPPVEMPRRISRPKTKKAGESAGNIQEGVTALPDDDEPLLTDNDIKRSRLVFAEAEPSGPVKDTTDYSLLYSRPIPADPFPAFNGASYTDDLRSQIFIEDAATSFNINDAEFSSLYAGNPYDEAAPPGEDEIPSKAETAAAKADTKKTSDAVFLPPPEPEPESVKASSSPLFDRGNSKSQSEEELKQNYIDVEYKNILTRFIRFDIEKAGTAAGAAAVKTAAYQAPARLASDSGLDDIKVRPHDKNANIQYTKKFYVYISRMSLTKNAILTAVMLFEILAYFLVFDVILKKVVAEERMYYYFAIVAAFLPLIYSLIAYAINPDRKKRVVNSYFEDLLIYILAAGVAVTAVYLICGWAFEMTRNNMEEFYIRMGLFMALSLNFIISSIIASVMHRSKKFAV